MPKPRTTALLPALRTASPFVIGVSVGDSNDKETWRVDFSDGASDDDRAAAYVALAAFNQDVPSAGEVDKERDRRVSSGFSFNGKLFQSRVQDQKRIAGAGTLATVAIMNGAQQGNLRWHGGASDFVWIAADNSLVTMDAPTVIAFGQAYAAWESTHVFAARAIKDTAPIPADFSADGYWPSLTG